MLTYKGISRFCSLEFEKAIFYILCETRVKMLPKFSAILLSILTLFLLSIFAFSREVTAIPIIRTENASNSVLIISFVLLMFIEPKFFYEYIYKNFSATEKKVSKKSVLNILKTSGLSLLFYISLITPYLLLSSKFEPAGTSVTASLMLIFVVFIVIFRLFLIQSYLSNWRIEIYLRIMLVLNLLIPLIGFCLWEFADTSVYWLSYLSPVWFMVVLTSAPQFPILPELIIWGAVLIGQLALLFLKFMKTSPDSK